MSVSSAPARAVSLYRQILRAAIYWPDAEVGNPHALHDVACYYIRNLVHDAPMFMTPCTLWDTGDAVHQVRGGQAVSRQPGCAGSGTGGCAEGGGNAAPLRSAL